MVPEHRLGFVFRCMHRLLALMWMLSMSCRLCGSLGLINTLGDWRLLHLRGFCHFQGKVYFSVCYPRQILLMLEREKEGICASFFSVEFLAYQHVVSEANKWEYIHT